MSKPKHQKRDILVTVVAPVLGNSATMVAFVKDVLALTEAHYTNYELVLIDGGADEVAIASLSQLLKDLPCIRLVRLSQRTNPDVMLFAGLEAAIGDYVVVMMPTMDPPRVVVDLVDIMLGG